MISLTKGEFLEGLEQNAELIAIAVFRGLKKNDPPVRVKITGPDSIEISLAEAGAKLISQILIKTVELIYQE